MIGLDREVQDLSAKLGGLSTKQIVQSGCDIANQHWTAVLRTPDQVVANLISGVTCSFGFHKRIIPRQFRDVKLTGRAMKVPGAAWSPIPLPNKLGSTPEAIYGQFTGKLALVTGAGSGLGEAIAKMLATRGAQVVVADINLQAAERVVGLISQSGGIAAAMQVDVGDAAAVEAMVKFAVDTYGGLDIAVNNAGIGGELNPTGSYSVESWQRVININLNGVFYSMRYEIPALLARGGGVIVNTASILGAVGTANSPAYVAAKHGVVGLTKAAALEYATQGIRVTSVGPGYIATPLLDTNLDADAQKAIGDLHPVKRLGKDTEIAALVVFLASDEASFITGSYHLADGGYTAQ
jgi:NAD(P)-dependent dehydrogenase (short-subunit alcohol dehydrogenase family)